MFYCIIIVIIIIIHIIIIIIIVDVVFPNIFSRPNFQCILSQPYTNLYSVEVVWFLLWHINFYGLINDKAIFVEED